MHGISATVDTDELVRWWQRGHVAHKPRECVCTQGGTCGSIESLCNKIAERTPVSRSTLFRRIERGKLSMEEADRFAVALGVPVYTIWPGFDRAPVTASLAPATPYGGTLF